MEHGEQGKKTCHGFRHYLGCCYSSSWSLLVRCHLMPAMSCCCSLLAGSIALYRKRVRQSPSHVANCCAKRSLPLIRPTHPP